MDEFVVEKNEQNQKKKLGNSKSQKRQKKKKSQAKLQSIIQDGMMTF